MKKLFLILAFLMTVLTASAFAQDSVSWNMLTDSAPWTTTKCTAGVENGAYSVKANAPDMNISIDLAASPFSAAEYPFFGIKYRAKAPSNQTALFWKNETFPSYTDKADALFDLTVDGGWHTLVVDMREVEKYDGSWAGNISAVRIDLINMNDENTVVDIVTMGFFKTEADANAFLGSVEAPAVAAPTPAAPAPAPSAPAQENKPAVKVDLNNIKGVMWDMCVEAEAKTWKLNGGKDSVEENVYFIQSTSTDVRIETQLGDKSFGANQYPYFGMKYKISSLSNQAAIFWTNETYPSFTDKADALFKLVVDDEWHIAVIDLREVEKFDGSWAGNITKVRLDPINASTPDTKIHLSRMGFFETAEEANAWLNEGEGKVMDSVENAKKVDVFWNFSDEKDRDSWLISGGSVYTEAGIMYVQASSTDITYTAQMGDKKFHALKYPWFALKYKSHAKKQGAAMFWTNGDVKKFTDKADFLFTTQNDGQWHDLVLDAREIEKYPDTWNGVITSLRFDPINPSTTECGMYIAAMGFFETEDAAKAYLAGVEVKEDYSEMSTFRDQGQVSYVPGGILSSGYNKKDYLVKDVTAAGNVVMYNDNGTEKVVTLSDVNGKGFVTFSPDRAAEYYLGTSGKEYVDVPGHWAKDYIDYTSARKLFGGTSETEFSPEEAMTRGMFITVLGRLCGVDGTTEGMYYDPYIKWSIEKGYADVTDAAAFRPEDAITRLEMAKFIDKYLNDCDYELMKSTYPAFADTASLTDSEKAAVENARAYGIINGKNDNMFDPAGLLTRAETATVMTRLIKSMLGVNASGYSADYIRRDRIKIGTKANFDPNQVDDDYLKTLADCGFDWMVATPGNSSGDVRNKILSFADAHGIEVYLSDEAITDNYDLDAEYYFHPSYAGTYIKDEPGTEEMAALAVTANEYLEKTGRDPHINLLPMYANAAQLKYGAGAAAIEYYDADPDLYYKHVATWASLAKADFMCVDIYPLNSNSTYKDYVESINIFARAARDYDKEFYAYIQAIGWNQSKRDPSVEDFRFQVYSMLSFGCKGFVYWYYWTDSLDYKDYALVKRDGTPTDIYYAAQTVIAETKKINDVYCTYNNIGAFNVNCTDKTPYLKMTNPVSFPAVNVTSKDPLLVGCFEAKEGNGKAITIVNMNELLEKKGAKASFTLNGYTTATAYIKGEPTVLTATDGVFTVSLESGEGVFITIE